MSAKFNVVTFTDRMIDLSWLVKLAQDNGLNINITQIESIKNWDFEDLINHKAKVNLNEIMQWLDNGRIVLLSGEMNTNSLGIMISKIRNVYETIFSMDTKYFSQLDDNVINDATKNIYDELSSIILSHEDVYGLLYSALGVEVVVNYFENFNELYQNSYNVVRWLIGKQEVTGMNNLNGYKQVAHSIWDKMN